MNFVKGIKSGFTIVELLIVIVIIGILASITIVTYNNVTLKAARAADIQTIQNYMTGLQLLAANNDLPLANSCLGPASTYTASTGNCLEGGQTATQADSATLNAKLKTVGVRDMSFVQTTGVTPLFVYNYANAGYYTISYNMALQTDCGLPNILSQKNGNGAWGLWGDKYTFYVNGATFCIAQFAV